MNGEAAWLRQNSPYRKHQTRRRHFCHTKCCGRAPEKTALEILHDHPDTGENTWFALYRCAACQRWYLFFAGRGKRLDSLLGHSVRPASSGESGQDA